jgi:hypothetical protein
MNLSDLLGTHQQQETAADVWARLGDHILILAAP